jgi:hypothetical protein
MILPSDDMIKHVEQAGQCCIDLKTTAIKISPTDSIKNVNRPFFLVYLICISPTQRRELMKTAAVTHAP